MAESAHLFPPGTLGDRVLVLGLGGSLDILSAYGVKGYLEVTHPDTTFLYGGADLCMNPQGFTPGVGCLYRHPGSVEAIVDRRRAEARLPTDREGCPLLFRLPSKYGCGVEEITQANLEGLLPAFTDLRVDAIIAVDCGGDSLTGGVRGLTMDSQDRQDATVFSQMMHAVQSSGIPWWHVVVGLACDGESTRADVQSALDRGIAEGAFVGRASVAGPVAEGLTWAHRLGIRDRGACPNIVLAALQEEQRVPGGMYSVRRGKGPVVPTEWVTGMYVWKWKHLLH